MPTSVLLAILAGAGLLALAPALVRRYDADERRAADLDEETSPASIDRKPHDDTPATDTPSGDIETETTNTSIATTSPRWEQAGKRQGTSINSMEANTNKLPKEVTVDQAQLRSWWQRRHRRVLYTLVALTLLELAGVIVIGPGFWLGAGISLALLFMFVRYLRLRVVRQTQTDATARQQSALAGRRQVYVPTQPDREIETGPTVTATTLTSRPDDDNHQDTPEPSDVTSAEPTAPSRRRTGGIRGRSYESPANL